MTARDEFKGHGNNEDNLDQIRYFKRLSIKKDVPPDAPPPRRPLFKGPWPS